MWEPLNDAGYAGTLFNMRLCDIVASGYDLGLMDYPIWDENKRQWLNERVLDHFALREIACETPTQFIFYLNRKMREVMPWLNVVFESNAYLETHDELLNNEEINVERLNQGRNSGTSSSAGDTTGKAYSSNDPTVSMIGQDEVKFFDTGTHSQSDSRSAGKSENEYSGSDTEHRKGHYGRTLTGAVSEYMESYSNSLQLLFTELEPLFMQVFDLPDMRFENPPVVWGWPGYAAW